MLKKMIITIDGVESDSVDSIGWSSTTNTLSIKFKSGDKLYSYEDIALRDLVQLLQITDAVGSLGKGLHAWRKQRTSLYESETKDRYAVAVDGLNVTELLMVQRWLGQDIQRTFEKLNQNYQKEFAAKDAGNE